MPCSNFSDAELQQLNQENIKYSKYARLLNSLGIILNTLGSTIILAYTIATFHKKPRNDILYQQVLLELSLGLIIIGCVLALVSIGVGSKVKIDITQRRQGQGWGIKSLFSTRSIGSVTSPPPPSGGDDVKKDLFSTVVDRPSYTGTNVSCPVDALSGGKNAVKYLFSTTTTTTTGGGGGRRRTSFSGDVDDEHPSIMKKNLFFGHRRTSHSGTIDSCPAAFMDKPSSPIVVGGNEKENYPLGVIKEGYSEPVKRKSIDGSSSNENNERD